MAQPETFEVCIIKMDRPSNEDVHKIYEIKNELNRRHSVMAGGEMVQKFIVIYASSRGDRHYLSYECSDLEEAAKFRAEAKEIYKTL